MARGIAAFVFVTGLVFALTILTGVGYIANVDGLTLDGESYNDDVQSAADQLSGIQYQEGRNSAILQGPLAVVVPVVDLFLTFQTVILNTSGLLQLLFGLPAVVADTLQTFFQLALVVTIGYLIRSGSPV